MPGASIDLNADLGEGCGDDAAMLEIVTSANIACGAHAGDAETMRNTVQHALANRVVIGAHVSYPDREHFGRRDMNIASAELSDQVLRQIGALDRIARECGTRVLYVKAHGALYNRMADDAVVADAVITAIQQFDSSLLLLTLPDCAAMGCARNAGVQTVTEAFADRAYTDDGRLVSRQEPGAVITDPEAVSQRSVAIAKSGTVNTLSGNEITIAARSLCVHGDTPGAVMLARAVRAALERAGVKVAAFA